MVILTSYETRLSQYSEFCRQRERDLSITL
jgi:hypothetical protein